MTEQEQVKEDAHNNNAEELRKQDANFRRDLRNRVLGANSNSNDNVYSDVARSQEIAADHRDKDMIRILERRGYKVTKKAG